MTNDLPIGRPSVLRHTNALRTLSVLRERRTCSRADLVRALHLSAPTITNVVRDLLAVGLVEPLGEGESSGGRPPDIIRFRAERGCILAVQISSRQILFLLTDLNGLKLRTAVARLVDGKKTPTAVCGMIQRTLRSLLRSQGKGAGDLLAVVVGVPAITHVDTGIVVSVTTLEAWRSVPLRAMLAELLGCLVIVENDTNLAAVGEHFRGAACGEQEFALVNIDQNVSAGIFLGGSIHHGSQSSAGEIAYLRLPNISRKQPALHEFGELERVLTEAGIVAAWQAAPGKRSSAGDLAPDPPSAAEILALAAGGDAIARKVVRSRAAIIADIVVNLSLILNPDLVLLGGSVGSHPALVAAVHAELQGSEFAITRVDVASLGEDAALWGAVSLGMQAVPGVLLPNPSQ